MRQKQNWKKTLAEDSPKLLSCIHLQSSNGPDERKTHQETGHGGQDSLEAARGNVSE